ncbi:MFS transporter [soil metagenome]
MILPFHLAMSHISLPRLALLRRNIKLLRAIQIVQSFMVTISIIVVFFQHRGFGLADVMILQAVFAAVMVLVEVPSGYFSDVVGRRRTMIIGSIFIALGWWCYPWATTFAEFLGAETLLAIGISFVSGTDSAMLYDTMLELDTAHHSVKAEGSRLSAGNFSEAVASVVGGALAGISLLLPFYVQACIAALLLPCAYLLVEPSVHESQSRVASMIDVLRIVRDVVVHDRTLRWILITSSVLGSSTLTMVWFIQPWWQASGVPIALFGVLWAACNAIVGVAAMRAHTIEHRVGMMTTITILSISVVLGLLALGLWQSVFLLPVVAVFYITRGTTNPIFTSAINERVTSDRRATVLSVRQLGVRAMFMVVGPVVGMIGDARGLASALLVTSAIFALALTIALSRWRAATNAIES